jgi:hypothetical protein
MSPRTDAETGSCLSPDWFVNTLGTLIREHPRSADEGLTFTAGASLQGRTELPPASLPSARARILDLDAADL